LPKPQKSSGWTVEIADVALRALKKLGAGERERIFKFVRTRLEGIADPRSIGEALHGDKSGLWRYRVGDYRLICMIEDARLVVLVLNIGHRREVYR
jgi:mRNA interferase RelE/StbE